MPDKRTELYAQRLAALIRQETVSSENQTDKQKFYAFQKLLWKQFPKIFACCEHEDFDGTISGEKLWGIGTLDTKCGLWAMLQAAEELLQEGFTPLFSVCLYGRNGRFRRQGNF